MLAVASNLFGRSSSLSAYTLHASNPSPNSSSTNLPSTSTSASPSAKSFNVGLWRVLGATHKTTGKDVSVWIFEKKMLDGIKGDGSGRTATASREWALEQIKKEATSLSRLRHPDILHMVEPLEESRSELTFVTETINSSLQTVLGPPKLSKWGGPPTAEAPKEVDLDEVEIQKGTLQIAKGLAFLHQQARMVHLNLSPDAILINSKGDWKLSGLSLTTPLSQPDGSMTKYAYPEIDPRLPPQVQWKFDYLAPEYALDSTMTPANDLYSLGCVLYAAHMGGRPPFQNRGSMQSLRDHVEGSLVRREWTSGSKWERCSSELKDLLPRLLTRHPSNRLSLASLPSHPFFSSLAISTLNFLDPTTFASKPREEKATFLRGLVRVLSTFSERLRKGKVLPSLLEEMKDPYLLPFILPNVFEISNSLSKEEFTTVLPKLQPLFNMKDPPQNMLTLLEHLSLFEEKTIPTIFRENVMPLIYNSLECEHLPVQEKVLRLVPHLCEILDYGTVQNVLLVKVAILFTRTRILSVKVQTLECFQSMVKTLDKATLTTKLVPLLAKIKTKEPAVMMATLGVQEAMGAKVDREAIATLVLPQLWAMSMGPLLNADQFGRFMAVIKALSSRVEQEHSAHLRDVRRIEQQTASFANGLANGSSSSMHGTNGGEVDFEALVKGQIVPMPSVTDPWADDGWADGGDLNQTLVSLPIEPDLTKQSQTFPGLSVSPTPTGLIFPSSIPASPAPSQISTMRHTSAGPSKLKARPIPSSSFNASVFESTPTPAFSLPAMTLPPPSFATLQPAQSLLPSQPPSSARYPSLSLQASQSRTASSGPNYNLALSPQTPAQPVRPTPAPSYSFSSPVQPVQPTYSSPPPPQPMLPAQPAVKPPPGWSSGLMQPTVAPKPAWGETATGKQSWDDFDPLK